MKQPSKNSGDCEIDYEAICEKMIENVKWMVDLQNEYFELLSINDEISSFVNTAIAHKNNMSLADNVTILRAAVNFGQCCKTLVEKYKLCDDEKEREEQCPNRN